ncbi:putative uncharacterized protein [Pseudomonas sp. StFLB209]|nr:putative uncharacterized protein [Pseudomonas sp. StFLB209]
MSTALCKFSIAKADLQVLGSTKARRSASARTELEQRTDSPIHRPCSDNEHETKKAQDVSRLLKFGVRFAPGRRAYLAQPAALTHHDEAKAVPAAMKNTLIQFK